MELDAVRCRDVLGRAGDVGERFFDDDRRKAIGVEDELGALGVGVAQDR